MHTEKVQEVTLEKGGWSSLTSDVRTRSRIKPPNFAREVYKILVKSSECDSKIYSLSRVGDSDDGTAWKVCDSFTYNYSWDDNALIEFLIVLIATKVKDGFVVTGNYIYEICSESESPTKRKKIESRRSLKGGTHILDIAKHFHLPINEAAKKLNICPTVLKKICRNNGLPRWPHRKLQSIDRELRKLSELLGDPSQNHDQILAISGRIAHLRKERDSICFQSNSIDDC